MFLSLLEICTKFGRSASGSVNKSLTSQHDHNRDQLNNMFIGNLNIIHVAIYLSQLTDHTGILENPISAEQHIRNCQTVINLVATDVLNVDLSHISGKAIVEGDKVSIRNFLEIFAGLLEYFMEYVDGEGMHACHYALL